MVRIRLRRVGLKKQPSYRIVVTDQRSPRDGRYIEIIGHYNPRTRPNTDIVDEGRVLYWLNNGAQPSDAVRKLLGRTGTWDRYERLRQGEAMEILVGEAEAAQAAAEPVSPRTQFPAPGPGESRLKAAAAAAAVASAAAVTEAVAEAPAETVADEVEDADVDEVEETAEAPEAVLEEATEADAPAEDDGADAETDD
jgi:small subunit ribosomal protein S16